MGAAETVLVFTIDFVSQIVCSLYTKDKSSDHVITMPTTTDGRDPHPVMILLDVPIQTSIAETTLCEPPVVTILAGLEPPRPRTDSSTMLKEEEDRGDEEDVAFDEERDEPSLTMSDSSDSSSSLDDLCLFSWPREEERDEVMEENRPVVPRWQQQPRRVSFHPHVEVREYSLTISDHPYCEDPYPISLDWAYAGPYLRYIDLSKYRGAIYNPGRRLHGVEAKRRRLAAVRGCSEMDIDAMAVARVPLSSNDEQFSLLLGRSILSYFSTICLSTKTTPTTRVLNQLDSLLDDDNDEYLLLYAGTTTSSYCATTRPATTLQDLEDGFS